MNSVTVTTKEELEKAKELKATEIIVKGELAEDLKKSKKIATASVATIAVITAALGAVPFTGGLSVAAAAPIAALTGMEIAAIIVAASIGITLIVGVFKNYEVEAEAPGLMKLKLKKAS